MNLCNRPATLPFAITLLAIPGSALPLQGTPIQPVSAQGLFSAYAVGMTVGDGIGAEQLVIRAPNVNGGVPVEWSATAFQPGAANHPDYTMGALTSRWRPAAPIPVPTFGGISTGGEVMPAVNAYGQLHMTTSNWYMLAVTVDTHAVGTGSSLLEIQRGGPSGGRDASADILSYYAIGSTGINPAFVDTVRLESSREQLGIDQVMPAASGMRSIRNLDYGIGVISVDPQNRAGSMFPVRDCFYFTLTQDWLSYVPNFQLGGQPANASTVYAMTWVMTPTPHWTDPEIAFHHSDLFDPELEGDIEIDALSVDRGPSGTPAWAAQRCVVSLTPASDVHGPFNQLLVYQRNITTAATPLRTDPNFGTSQLFTDQLGLISGAVDPDNITGTCGGDPKEHNRLNAVVALSTDQPAMGDGELGFSGLRTCTHSPSNGSDEDADATDTLHLQITGMDFSPFQFGVVQLYREAAVPTSGAPGPSTEWGAPILIEPSAVVRNSIDLAGPLPCTVKGEVFRVSAQIVGVDLTPGLVIRPLRQSWVLSIVH